jgi:hypothetical protein
MLDGLLNGLCGAVALGVPIWMIFRAWSPPLARPVRWAPKPALVVLADVYRVVGGSPGTAPRPTVARIPRA